LHRSASNLGSGRVQITAADYVCTLMHWRPSDYANNYAYLSAILVAAIHPTGSFSTYCCGPAFFFLVEINSLWIFARLYRPYLDESISGAALLLQSYAKYTAASWVKKFWGRGRKFAVFQQTAATFQEWYGSQNFNLLLNSPKMWNFQLPNLVFLDEKFTTGREFSNRL